MQSTIGEIANELLPYSNKIEMNMVNDLPFIKANIGGSTGITKAIIYVIQTELHKYAICDDYNDPLNRYLPTGNITNPFILEKEIIQRWYNDSSDNIEIKVLHDLDLESFVEYLYERLYHYGIILFNPENKDLKFSELGFNNIKIRNTIEKSFKFNSCESGTIKDLINIINKENKSFSLRGLREREINCIFAKLRSIGIHIVIEDKIITKLYFERKI